MTPRTETLSTSPESNPFTFDAGCSRCDMAPMTKLRRVMLASGISLQMLALPFAASLSSGCDKPKKDDSANKDTDDSEAQKSDKKKHKKDSDGSDSKTAASSNVPVGGDKACLYAERGMCGEIPDSKASDKSSCEADKGQWALKCPTENLLGTCNGIVTIRYYKPAYTADSIKVMCSDKGDKLTMAP